MKSSRPPRPERRKTRELSSAEIERLVRESEGICPGCTHLVGLVEALRLDLARLRGRVVKLEESHGPTE